MKKLIFFAVMIGMANIGFPQFSGTYICDNWNNTPDIFVDFCVTGNYQIYFIEYPVPDVQMINVLSGGNFVKKNETIMFSDAIHGFEMAANLRGKELEFTKSLIGLRNRIFVFDSWSHQDCNMKEYQRLQKRTQQRINYKNQNLQLFDLKFGVYGIDNGIKLKVQPERLYQLYYKGFLLSEGKWAKVNNELLLFDTSLYHYFYALIGKDRLISNFLPGDFIGTTNLIYVDERD